MKKSNQPESTGISEPFICDWRQALDIRPPRDNVDRQLMNAEDLWERVAIDLEELISRACPQQHLKRAEMFGSPPPSGQFHEDGPVIDSKQPGIWNRLNDDCGLHRKTAFEIPREILDEEAQTAIEALFRLTALASEYIEILTCLEPEMLKSTAEKLRYLPSYLDRAEKCLAGARLQLRGTGVVRSHDEQIYQAYPRKGAKADAMKAIKKALKKKPFEFLLERTQSYARSRSGKDPKLAPLPASWFNSEQFNDGSLSEGGATKDGTGAQAAMAFKPHIAAERIRDQLMELKQNPKKLANKDTPWIRKLKALPIPMEARNVDQWWAVAKVWLDERWRLARDQEFQLLYCRLKFTQRDFLVSKKEKNKDAAARKQVIDDTLRKAFLDLVDKRKNGKQ